MLLGESFVLHRWNAALAIALSAAFVVCEVSNAYTVRDRRVVDLVRVGDSASEAAHGYAANNAMAGVAFGKPYRSARGWMRYALTTFDDTEVTVACTFVNIDNAAPPTPHRYDVVVEDSLIATGTFSEATTSPVVVELIVPFVLTKGRTSIAVIIRGHGGATPALRELRVIQDHNEVDQYAVPRLTNSLRTPR